MTKEELHTILARVLSEREAKFQGAIRSGIERLVQKRVDERLLAYRFDVERAIADMISGGDLQLRVIGPEEEP